MIIDSLFTDSWFVIRNSRLLSTSIKRDESWFTNQELQFTIYDFPTKKVESWISRGCRFILSLHEMPVESRIVNFSDFHQVCECILVLRFVTSQSWNVNNVVLFLVIVFSLQQRWGLHSQFVLEEPDLMSFLCTRCIQENIRDYYVQPLSDAKSDHTRPWICPHQLMNLTLLQVTSEYNSHEYNHVNIRDLSNLAIHD